jgi:hypothetical protein
VKHDIRSLGGFIELPPISDTQPSQTCSGGFIKTELYAACCCFFAIEEYNQIKSNQIKSNQIKSNQIKSNLIKSNQIKSNQI